MRKIAAVTLAVSFIAMATSRIMMYVVESLNFRGLLNHLKTRSIAVYGSVLVALLVLLYGVAVNKTIPPELAQQMDAAAAQADADD